jgi:hypothetical protein
MRGGEGSGVGTSWGEGIGGGGESGRTWEGIGGKDEVVAWLRLFIYGEACESRYNVQCQFDGFGLDHDSSGITEQSTSRMRKSRDVVSPISVNCHQVALSLEHALQTQIGGM